MILYRSFLLCVVALWATMWVLLIRSELQPESTGLRAIPVEHVLREAFRVEKDSDLWISNGPTHIGSLRLTPKTDPTDETRTLNFSGRVTVTLPDGGSQRPGWMGELTMKPDWTVQYFHLTTITREYSPVLGGSPMRSTEVELELRPPIHRGWYVVRVGPEVMDHHEFSLDEVGLSQLLSHLGIDESTLKQFPATKGRPPEITARRSSMAVRGEKLETYLVTVTLKGQTLLEVQLSQLGEVLHVQTLIGWTLEQVQ